MTLKTRPRLPKNTMMCAVSGHPARDPERVVGVAPDVVFVLDAAATVRYANDAAHEVLGIDRDRWEGMSVLDLVHPDDLAVVASSMGTVQGKVIGTPIEVRVRDEQRGWRWMEVLGADRLEVPGVEGIVCVARDITSRRIWEVAAGDVERFQQVIQHASSITLLLDAGGLVGSVNGAFTRLLGHDPSLVVARSLASFATPDGAALLTDALDQIAGGARSMSLEVPMRTAPPGIVERPVRFELVNLLDDPVVAGIVVTGHDVSELQVARQELQYLAHHDALTGLANRALLLETMQAHVDAGRPLAVIFVDLDKFKAVNDLFGHEAGDELLREVAARINSAVRPDDLVARVGGDEFVVVAPSVCSRSAAAQVGERIEAAVSEPYVLRAGPVRIGASIGLAVSDESSTVAELLADADFNMYDIKSDRRGEGPRPMEERRRSSQQRRRLADDLIQGLDRGEMVAHLQPIVDLSAGMATAFEALARWNHPELGELAPSTFVDLAEDAGLDCELGDAVAAAACAALTGLMSQVPEIGRPLLAVNLSVGQLSDRRLTLRLQGVLDRYGMDMSQLVVEVTERATLARGAPRGGVPPEVTLLELHRLGAALSLDDFGTGHSSLTHVRRYPLRYLKIDQSFVARMLDHPEDHAVVAAVVGLGAALGLRVVAEGVESEAQAAELTRLGCHEGQGYLLGRPMPADVLAEWARERYPLINSGTARQMA